MLFHPDLTKPFFIQADASAIAIGGRLYQRYETEENTITLPKEKY